MRHTSITNRVCAGLALTAALACTPVLAEDENVSTLLYYNNGGYTIKSVRVHWLDEAGEDQSKKFEKNLTLGMGFCFDIDAANKNGSISIPNGTEVWLSYNIAAGDKKSCRKDGTKVLYKSGSYDGQYYLSEGTTLNNNRCKLKKPPTSMLVGKSGGNCEFTTVGY